MSDIVIEVRSRFPQITAQMIVNCDRAIERGCYTLLARAQIKLATGPKTGRIYKRGNALHQASAPGEAPAVDTGALLNSGFVRRRGVADFEVGFSTAYAAILERDLNRPYLRPATEEQAPLLRHDVIEAMRR